MMNIKIFIFVFCALVYKNNAQVFRTKYTQSNMTFALASQAFPINQATALNGIIYYGNILSRLYLQCSLSSGGSLGTYCPSQITFVNLTCGASACTGVNRLIYSNYYNFDWNSQSKQSPVSLFGSIASSRYNYKINYLPKQDYFSILENSTLLLNSNNYILSYNCPLLTSIKPNLYLNNSICSKYNRTSDTTIILTKFYPPVTNFNYNWTIEVEESLSYCYPLADTCYFDRTDIYCYYSEYCLIDWDVVITGWSKPPVDGDYVSRSMAERRLSAGSRAKSGFLFHFILL